MARALAAVAALVIAGTTACGSSQPARPATAGVRAASAARPTLAGAIKHAVHLGPAGTATQVELSLGLKVRQADRLAKLLASGHTVTPEQYQAEFGPDPTQVAAALHALMSAGLHASWLPGSALIAADGPAPAVAAAFGVGIQDQPPPGRATVL